MIFKKKNSADPAPEDVSTGPQGTGEDRLTDGEEAVPADGGRFGGFVGWSELKALCGEIEAAGGVLKKTGGSGVFGSMAYLFSVNSGCGLSTALEKLCDVIGDAGLFGFNENRRVKEMVLVPGPSIYCNYTMTEAVSYLNEDDHDRQLICFDISEYLPERRHDELKAFLRMLVAFYQSSDRFIVAFRVPYLEPDALRDVERLVGDVMFVRTVRVPPYTDGELWRIACASLAGLGFEPGPGVRDIFDARIREEKSDGRFYGARTAVKVASEMIWLAAASEAGAKAKEGEPAEDQDVSGGSNVAVIEAGEVGRLANSGGGNGADRDGFDELAELVGMEEIGERIREIVAQLKAAKSNAKLERPCLHMRFTGAPGTGKTTVARIIGKIFRENGLLRNGYFIEVTGRDLCGEYVGQTAPRTLSYCRDAYGSVLFIDEAYSLFTEQTGASNDYGREAIVTLVSEMENHRDDMVVIMAGYTGDMDRLMEANPGLRSRMPYKIEFRNYSREQLADIFLHMARKSFTFGACFEESVRSYFRNLSDSYIGSQEFSNARFARNLFERTWSKAALRCAFNGVKCEILEREDFEAASAESEFSEKLQESRKIGFE